MSLSLKIKFVAGGADHPLPALAPETTVLAVKELLLQAGKGSDSVARQRLIYKGKILKDEETLGSHGMKSGETIIAQITKAPGSASKPTPAASPTSSTSTAPAATPSSPAPPAAATSAPSPTTMGSGSSADEDSMYENSAPAVSGPPEMLAAMDALVSGNDAPAARLGLETLTKVLDNIVNHPNDAKYRSLKTSNAVFNRKLGGLTGGRACLLAAGFVADDAAGTLSLEASAEAWDHLNACRSAVASRIATLPPKPSPPPPAAAPSPPAAAPASPFTAPGLGASPFGAGFPGAGFPGAGGPGGGLPGLNPQMMQTMMSNPMVQQMMSDPTAIQAMMQHPMVQQMMSSNPQMAQQMQMLMQNPGMMQQAMQAMSDPTVQAMMQNPAMMEQMSQMMGGMPGGGFGGFGGFPPALPQQPPSTGTATPATPATTQPSTPGAAPTTAPTPSGGSTAEAKTEEELIAEAIARSMQEK